MGASARAVSRWSRLREVVRTDVRRLLTTGVPHLLAALFLMQGIGILRRILLVRMLSLAEMAQMVYVTQIADLLVVLADLGICTAVLKFAAEPVSEQRRRQLYTAGLLWGGALAGAVGLLYLLATLTLPLHPDARVRVFMAMVAPYIPLAAIVRTPLVFMQARKEIKRAARFTTITQVISLVLLVAATYLYGLWGFFVTVTVAPLSNLILLLTATRTHIELIRPSRAVLRQLTGFGFLSVITNGAHFASATATVVLLEWLTRSDAQQTGPYAVALQIFGGMQVLPMALMNTAFPYLSGLLAAPVRLRARMWELSLKQTLVMSGVVVAWWLSGWCVIPIVFGAEKAPAYWPSVVLAVGVLAYSIGAPAGQTLLALGHVRLNLGIAIVKLVLDLGACLVLIPWCGKMGAAAALAGGYVASSGLSILVAERVLGRLVRMEGADRG
ncbi:MAG: oligosaccharide flippase family protein [Planctomycetota bacterium]